MSRTPVFIAILFVYAIFLSACESQEKKPSQDVLLTQRVFGQMERLRQAYAARDKAALDLICSEETYGSLIKGMSDFRSAKLEFEYKWVNIKADGSIEVRVAWSGKWTLAGEEAGVSDSGSSVFVLGGGQMKLMDIRGASPFAVPSGA
jgi:hypothetical protein